MFRLSKCYSIKFHIKRNIKYIKGINNVLFNFVVKRSEYDFLFKAYFIE